MRWLDEMVGWHHQLNGHEFEQTPGDGKGQGRLVCCSPWAEQLNSSRDREQTSGCRGQVVRIEG